MRDWVKYLVCRPAQGGTKLARRLESRWYGVESLTMHARVSMDPAPAGSLPIVLVHGIGVASRFMVPVAELLSPYHRVYAPDLRGFGASGKPARVLNVSELTDALVGGRGPPGWSERRSWATPSGARSWRTSPCVTRP